MDDENSVNLYAEEFYKLYKIVTELRANGILDSRGRPSLPPLAKEGLSSSFWSWPADAEGVDTSSDTAWCRGLLQNKLLQDASRVRCHAVMLHNLLLQSRSKASSRLQSLRDAGYSEDVVSSVVRRFTAVQTITLRLHTTVMNAYKSAASILYDFDVVLSPPDTMSLISTGKVMPLIIEMFGIAYSEGVGAMDAMTPSRNKSKVRSSVRKTTLEAMIRTSSKRLSERHTVPMARGDDPPDPDFPTFGTPGLEVVEVSDGDPEAVTVVPPGVPKQDDMASLAETSDSDSEGDSDSANSRSAAERCLSACRQCLVPPIITAMRELKYDRNSFRSDLMASVIISAAGIPKAMSYAALTGLPVAAGIVTMYVPCVVYALVGHSRQGAISPQSVPCLLLAALVEEELQGSGFETDQEERAVVTLLYTLVTGVIMMTMGFLQLSFLLRFISKPVLSGFVSASSLIAAASTAKSLLGIKLAKSPLLHETLAYIVQGLPGIKWPTTALSVAFILAYVLHGQLKKFAKKRSKRGGGWKALTRALEVPSVVPIVLLGAFIGACLCDFRPFTKWTPEHMVLGSGSTSAAPIFVSAGEAFNTSKYDDRKVFRYSASGSGEGLRQVMDGGPWVDFGSSDVRPSDAELLRANISATFPVAQKWICALANVPMVRGSHQISLVMDLQLLADIFDGTITHWSDPRIQQLNPNLPWSGVNQRITVVARAGKSGTTYHFAEVLSANSRTISANMSANFGAQSQVLVSSNVAVVKTVASNEWSIGYATTTEVDAGSGAAACVALRTGQRIVTVQGALGSRGTIPWPFQMTSHVLVPSGPVVAPAGTPRHSFCLARDLLHYYLEQVFATSSTAVPQGMQLMPRPQGLDSILCPGGRRLAGSSKHSSTCSSIKMVGHVEPSLPTFSFPAAKAPIDLGGVITKSLMLAVVILLEHVAIVKHYSEKHGHSVAISADLMAVGLANILGALSGSFIVACGLSRSALNGSAVSQISLLLSAIVSLAIVYAVAPVISMLPDPVLGVVLFMAVIHMVDIHMIQKLVRLRMRGVVDLVMLTVAFIATCVLGVVQGMISAVAFSLVVFIFNSTYPQISELERRDGSATYMSAKSYDGVTELASRLFPAKEQSHSSPLLVLRFEAPLWFANVGRLRDVVMAKLNSGTLSKLVLEMSTTPWMDTSAAVEFDKLLLAAEDNNVEVCLVAASQVVKDMLVGICGDHVAGIFFDSVYEAVLPKVRNHWDVSWKELMKDSQDC